MEVTLSGLAFSMQNQSSSLNQKAVWPVLQYYTTNCVRTNRNWVKFKSPGSMINLLSLDIINTETNSTTTNDNICLQIAKIVCCFSLRKVKPYIYTMSNSPSWQLQLRTYDINSSTTYSDYDSIINNSIGTIMNKRCTYIWKNLDMKKILGMEAYQKYSKFNIGCYSIIGSSCGGTSATTDQRTLLVKMSGLPFISSYDVVKRENAGTVIITGITPSTTASTSFLYNNHNVQQFTFYKHDSVNIRIDLVQVSSDSTPTYTNPYYLGHIAFSFVITPVE